MTTDEVLRNVRQRLIQFSSTNIKQEETPHLLIALENLEKYESGGRPISLLLCCPLCTQRHVDVGLFTTKLHHTHACQFCGHVWRPAIENTVGVQFLPGFKD